MIFGKVGQVFIMGRMGADDIISGNLLKLLRLLTINNYLPNRRKVMNNNHYNIGGK
jgi:hypothetical protein